MNDTAVHAAVMVDEAFEYLNLKKGAIVVDCTIGAAGHSKKILEKITTSGKLIGIDTDREILDIAEKRLENFKGSYILKETNFRDLDKALAELAISRIDAALFDLGVSSLQLNSRERGFSFNLEGPLDMRMGKGAKTAYSIVNFLSRDELADIIFKFGEERYSRRIADAITKERRLKPIETTAQLKGIILRAVPGNKKWQKIHPATRTFQALRIAVNDELSALEAGLRKAIKLLSPGGRLCVISFHSLEDRIVKNIFKEAQKEGAIRILTKKPVCPSRDEIMINPRARSAKLRAVEKAGSMG